MIEIFFIIELYSFPELTVISGTSGLQSLPGDAHVQEGQSPAGKQDGAPGAGRSRHDGGTGDGRRQAGRLGVRQRGGKHRGVCGAQVGQGRMQWGALCGTQVGREGRGASGARVGLSPPPTSCHLPKQQLSPSWAPCRTGPALASASLPQVATRLPSSGAPGPLFFPTTDWMHLWTCGWLWDEMFPGHFIGTLNSCHNTLNCFISTFRNSSFTRISNFLILGQHWQIVIYLSMLYILQLSIFPPLSVIVYRENWPASSWESISAFALSFFLNFPCGIISHIAFPDPNLLIIIKRGVGIGI